jgi:hypothetical protein
MTEPQGPQKTSEHGEYEWHAELTRLQARTRIHTPKRPGTRTHAYTHTQICNINCFSTEKIIRERASVLRYA